MSHPSKVKGWADEAYDRRVYLSRVWPDCTSHHNKQHPTKDHAQTDRYHVQSKKRKTWNIKDVVREMLERVPEGEPWVILYSDGDKRKKDAIKDDVVILPAVQYFEELRELHEYRELGVKLHVSFPLTQTDDQRRATIEHLEGHDIGGEG